MGICNNNTATGSLLSSASSCVCTAVSSADEQPARAVAVMHVPHPYIHA